MEVWLEAFLKIQKINRQNHGQNKQNNRAKLKEKKKESKIKKEPKSLNPGNQSEHNTQSLHRKDGKTLQRECVCVNEKFK